MDQGHLAPGEPIRLELPIGTEPEGQWSGIHIATFQCFLVFSVKYADFRLLPEKF